MYMCEEKGADTKLTNRNCRQEKSLFTKTKPYAKKDKNKVQKAKTRDMIEHLHGKAAHIVIGITVRVVISQYFLNHRPEKDEHTDQSTNAEQNQIFDSTNGGSFFSLFGQFGTAEKQEDCVRKIVANDKI